MSQPHHGRCTYLNHQHDTLQTHTSRAVPIRFKIVKRQIWKWLGANEVNADIFDRLPARGFDVEPPCPCIVVVGRWPAGHTGSLCPFRRRHFIQLLPVGIESPHNKLLRAPITRTIDVIQATGCSRCLLIRVFYEQGWHPIFTAHTNRLRLRVSDEPLPQTVAPIRVESGQPRASRPNRPFVVVLPHLLR